MKLPRFQAGAKIAIGAGQLLLTLLIMVFYFTRLIRYDNIDPCTLFVAISLCFSGITFIGRGRKELAKANHEHRRKNKPKPPRPERPKGPPGKQRPDKERRKRRGGRKAVPTED